MLNFANLSQTSKDSLKSATSLHRKLSNPACTRRQAKQPALVSSSKRDLTPTTPAIHHRPQLGGPYPYQPPVWTLHTSLASWASMLETPGKARGPPLVHTVAEHLQEAAEPMRHVIHTIMHPEDAAAEVAGHIMSRESPGPHAPSHATHIIQTAHAFDAGDGALGRGESTGGRTGEGARPQVSIVNVLGSSPRVGAGAGWDGREHERAVARGAGETGREVLGGRVETPEFMVTAMDRLQDVALPVKQAMHTMMHPQDTAAEVTGHLMSRTNAPQGHKPVSGFLIPKGGSRPQQG